MFRPNYTPWERLPKEAAFVAKRPFDWYGTQLDVGDSFPESDDKRRMELLYDQNYIGVAPALKPSRKRN